MNAKFDYFVVFAEMRTGSNFLESNLNTVDGLHCHGEAFNPHFIGYPNRENILGITQEMRDENPLSLIEAVKKAPGKLNGFRFFHDHDSRVLDLTLPDLHCAKIILTRNPLDSYVSWKIARETGQWKLTNAKRRKDAKANFDTAEFTRRVHDLQAFQVFLLNSMQRSGQSAFYLDYEDLQDVEVINGLVHWLGLDSRIDKLDDGLKRQNPGQVSDKVANPEVMSKAVADLDIFNLSWTPSFEPRRGPAVPSYVAGLHTPLMFQPVKCGLEDDVAKWLADLDGVTVPDLQHGMTQKNARQWMREHPGHRRFTILRHPLARAHTAFCRHILPNGPGSYSQIRNTLRRRFQLPIPADGPGKGYTVTRHREAFEAFLRFLQLNLAGQTGIRLDGSWGPQSSVLTALSGFAPPDHVIRETEASKALPALARHLGHPNPPPIPQGTTDTPYGLSDIYDADLEALAQDLYQRDFLLFGFEPFRPV